MTRIFNAAILPCCAALLLCSAPAGADETVPVAATPQASTQSDPPDGLQQLPPIVVQTSAIPGTAIDADKFPGNVQSLRASDLTREGSASLTRAMNSQLGSINVNDNLDDPFQPDILYRGFEASPVLGTPQGIAVYQNGVRINEAFGDTVNWDLFPDIAINRVDIVSSNPVYGLNALGAGISVSMKNGFIYKGSEIELSGGSFGQRSVVAQYGVNSGPFGFYIAGKALDEDGWRMFSSDSIRQLYTAFSARSEHGSIDLSYTHADNQLNGQGAAPVQELAIDRSLVFTGPQGNQNKLDFLALNGSYEVNDTLSLQGVLYYRQYGQNVANGNTTNYTSCTNAANALCQSDGLTPITTASGAIIPDLSNGGTVPIGENDFETIRAYGRGAAIQTADSHDIFGHGNQFTAGATVDYASVHFYSAAQIGTINSQLLVQPSSYIVDTPEGSAFNATPVSLQAVNKYYGLYVTDTFDVSSAFSVTASGRYNVAYIDLQDLRGTSLTGDNRYTHFNPAFGGTYKLLPTITAYAGISENTRTPTASEIECSNPLQPCLLPSNLAGDPPTLRQVVAHTYEFGVRGKLHGLSDTDGSGSWNLGAFRTVLDDDIYGVATSISSGFFQNIGATRRQGVEAGMNYRTGKWSAYANYSYVDATFQSSLTLPSPSNPFQGANGNIQVQPGNRLPGIPQNRFKLGADYQVQPNWTIGATWIYVGSFYYFGDESNQLVPLPAYNVFNLHTTYKLNRQVELFANISNLFNARYANYGILSDPTGIGAPGIPANAVTNGPGVDPRFQSPAAPFAAFAGIRVSF